LSGGVFTVRAPTQSPLSGERRHSFDTVSDDSDGEEADFVARLDELAVAPGRRGRLVARCALTTVRVVGTAPQHGEQAFRLVLDGGRRHVFMKAQSYDDMCHWLLGFHRSLAAVVARLKRQPPGSPLPFRGRASSADNGSPQSATSDDLHKKSAHRPRTTASLYIGRAAPGRFARASTSRRPCAAKGVYRSWTTSRRSANLLLRSGGPKRACGGARPSRANAVLTRRGS
jgi:hypothetical protein